MEQTNSKLPVKRLDALRDKISVNLEKRIPELMAKSKTSPEDMMVALANAIEKNPTILRCSKESILKCFIDTCTVGLLPNTIYGHAYLIPYKEQGIMTLHYQLGYQGLLELVRRADIFRKPPVPYLVYENELKGLNGGQFEIRFGDNPRILHKPIIELDENNKIPRGKLIGGYVVLVHQNKEKTFIYRNIDFLNKIKSLSKTIGKNDSPWKMFEEQMHMKTLLIQALKYQAKTELIAEAINRDEEQEFGRVLDDQKIEEAKTLTEQNADNLIADVTTALSADEVNELIETDTTGVVQPSGESINPSKPLTLSSVQNGFFVGDVKKDDAILDEFERETKEMA